ncbi:MAG TPA: PhnD/SsuA/transferrin family substrate-binding protein [Xanthomonadaceae bacterium]|nr:PhnD/SsuA/transferrin family substrate-binding protein [Xanthomonadaceae bacterium]
MSNPIVPVRALLGTLALALATVGPVRAESYSLLVEPTYDPVRAAGVYEPLINYLRKETGLDIRLQTSRNFHFYWRDLRRNEKFDFVFEEAHFTDFRTKRFGFTPLVRTAEPSVYTLLVRPEDAREGLDGLIGHNIVCMPAPSMGFAALLGLFNNPVAQPEIITFAASWRDGVEMIYGGEAKGAMVPRWLNEEYHDLVAIAESTEFAGPAISASSTVPEEARSRVREALLVLHEKVDDDPTLYEILHELGITRFEPATRGDYDGAERMLQGFHGYDRE